MSPLLDPFFNTVFISHCVNTSLPAHTVLCKLFKHSSRRTQTSSSPEASHRDTGTASDRTATRTTLASVNCNHRCWGYSGGQRTGRGFIRAGKAARTCSALPHDTRMESQAPVWGTGTTCPMSTPCASTCCHTSLDAPV